MLQFLVFSIIASALLVAGAGYPFTNKSYGYLCIMLGMISGFSSLWAMYKEMMKEITENLREKERAKAQPIIEMSHALRGLSESQTELVAKQLYFHVEGTTMQDDGVLWRVNFPGGIVPLEFIETFLISSLTTAPYSHPVRDHTHPIFSDFTNVEQMLSIVTNAFIYKGWLQKAEGPYSAKLAPGESFARIGRRFGLMIE